MSTPDPEQELREAGARLEAARQAVEHARADVAAAAVKANAAGVGKARIAELGRITRPTVYSILEQEDKSAAKQADINDRFSAAGKAAANRRERSPRPRNPARGRGA